MIKIVEATTKQQKKLFVRFANQMYKECPYYTPVLEYDDMNTFTVGKNPALEHSDFVLYLAYRDDKIVGRICGIINKIANERWGTKKCRFGWFDFENDFEISRALLEAVADWGRRKGMEVMNGPVGFTDFDHEGLLLEGFEYYAPMASLYNYPYYAEHLDRMGFRKEADWVEVQAKTPAETPERIRRISELVMEKYHLRIDKVKSAKELQKKYGLTYFDVLDSAYQKLYNFQPLTEKQKQYYSDMYFPLLNFDFVSIIVNEHDEIVGVGLGMPDISKQLKATDGRLFPFGWIKILRGLKAKQFDVIDLLLIAVREDYQEKGVNALFFYDMLPYFRKYGIKYAETTAILETNTKNLGSFEKNFESKRHKRRRAYIKEL